MHHNEWIYLKPNSVTPFWPNRYQIKEKRYVVLRHLKAIQSTKSFWFNSKNSCAFTLEKNVIFEMKKKL